MGSSVATFSRGEGNTSTEDFTTGGDISLAGGQVLAATAAQVDGVLITGGEVHLSALEAGASGIDLANIYSTVTAELDSTDDVAFAPVVSLGWASITVSGNGTVSFASGANLGGARFDLGTDASLTLSASQANWREVTGTGHLTITSLLPDTRLTDIASDLDVTAIVTQSMYLDAVDLTNVDHLMIDGGEADPIVVKGTAAQIDAFTGRLTLGAGDSFVEAPAFEIVEIENGGIEISFGGTATGVITLTGWSGTDNLVATFSRGTYTATANFNSVGSIALASGQILAATAADVDGLYIHGAGQVRISALEGDLAADLSHITSNYVMAALDSTGDVVFSSSANLGNALIAVSGTGNVSADSSADLGSASFEVGAGASLTLSAAQAEGHEVDGEGDVTVTGLQSETGLELIMLEGGRLTATVTSDQDIQDNETLGFVNEYQVATGATLTLNANQVPATASSLTGAGGVTILGSAGAQDVYVNTQGNNVIALGAGADNLFWETNTGDTTVVVLAGDSPLTGRDVYWGFRLDADQLALPTTTLMPTGDYVVGLDTIHVDANGIATGVPMNGTGMAALITAMGANAWTVAYVYGASVGTMVVHGDGTDGVGNNDIAIQLVGVTTVTDLALILAAP